MITEKYSSKPSKIHSFSYKSGDGVVFYEIIDFLLDSKHVTLSAAQTW